MKAFACWSGGKESAISCYRAEKMGIDVAYLVNMVSEDGRYSRSHRIPSALLRMQAEAIGIPIVQCNTSWKDYEEKFKKRITRLKKEGIEIGVFGDIDIQEHRDWVEDACKDSGIRPILPLWKEKREKLLNDFIKEDFKAIVVVTQANLLGRGWLGQRVDKKFMKRLKALGNIDLCGEKGEYHTLVFDGPIFKEPLEIITGNKIFKDNHWFLEIVPDRS